MRLVDALCKQMRHARTFIAYVKRLNLHFHIAVGDQDSLVLTYVLEPRFVHETLDKTRRIGRVLE